MIKQAYTTCIFILLSGLAWCNHPTSLKIPYLELEIWQNGKKVEAVADTFRIQPAPFSFHLIFQQSLTIYLNTSFTNFYFRKNYSDYLEESGDPLQNPAGFILPEEENNADSVIYIDAKGLHYWCYAPTNHTDNCFNKFNSISQKNGKVTAVREIAQLWYLYRNWPITSFKFPIHIFMIATASKNKQHPFLNSDIKRYVIVWLNK